MVIFWVCAWSALVLLGAPSAVVLVVLALALGWSVEQTGASWGWYFGRYTHTDVLDIRLSDVPLAIPLTRFLMNRLRPLALHEQVLNPLPDTIAAWGQVARAPDGVNAL